MPVWRIIEICIVFIFLAAMIIVAIINIRSQKNDYNNGKCPICEGHLKLCNYNKNGSRGYICDSCGYVCWVSWKIVDRKY